MLAPILQGRPVSESTVLELMRAIRGILRALKYEEKFEMTPKIILASSMVLTLIHVAAAQESSGSLFHVRQSTYACKNRNMVVYATSAAAAGHAEDQQVRAIFAQGRCVSITPRSPWRFLSMSGNFSLMAYAGTTGAPGSYYFQTSELFDADGHTPAEDAAAAPSVSSSAPAPTALMPPAAAPTADTPQPTPTPLEVPPAASYSDDAPAASPAPDTAATEASPPQPTPPVDEAAPPPSAAPDTGSATQPTLAEPEPQDRATGSTNTRLSGTAWGILILIALAFAGFIVNIVKKQRAQAELQRQTIASAYAEIDAKAQMLGIRRIQLTPEDHYGTRSFEKWFKEIQMFLSTRIEPIFYQAGLKMLYTQIKQQIAQEVDAAAVRNEPVTMVPTIVSNPSVFNETMDPIHYEMFCSSLLQSAGWHTRLTSVTGDQGADVIAEKNGVKVVVQCKRYSSPVGNGAVQEAFSAKTFQRADIAVVATNAGFTPSARALAATTGVRLLHHSELASFTP